MGLFKKSSSSRLGGNVSSSPLRRSISPSSLAKVVKSLPSSSSSGSPAPVIAGNPDPARYTVEQHTKVGRFLIVQALYHGCTNYEGRKIMVFENATMAQLEKQRLMDPHFCDNSKYKHPVARFEPTPRGWDWAVAFASLQLS